MTAFLYLCNILCASGQSAFGKQYARSGGKAAVFNINKAFVGAVLFLLCGLLKKFSFHIPTAVLGICYGIVLCCSMHTGFQALSIGPMALTSMIASFSLVIPFFFGICFWNETLTAFKAVGMLLLLVSIWLINAEKGSKFSVKWLLYATATLLANGICSVVQKLHQIHFPTLYRAEFMFWAMVTVLAVLFIVRAGRKGKADPFRFSLLGMASGVLNCAANYVVLYLSATENASVLFPVISVANTIAVWIIGVLFFKERLKGLQMVGLIVGVTSVVLLKL